MQCIYLLPRVHGMTESNLSAETSGTKATMATKAIMQIRRYMFVFSLVVSWLEATYGRA